MSILYNISTLKPKQGGKSMKHRKPNYSYYNLHKHIILIILLFSLLLISSAFSNDNQEQTNEAAQDTIIIINTNYETELDRHPLLAKFFDCSTTCYAPNFYPCSSEYEENMFITETELKKELREDFQFFVRNTDYGMVFVGIRYEF